MRRYADAIDPLDGAVASAEGEHRKTLCFYLGVCHYENEHWDAAEEKLIDGLPADRRDPWWPQSQYYLGCLYFKRGAYLHAEKAFEICAFFIDDANVEMKENVAAWLADTRTRLGDRGESRTQ